MMLNNDQLVNEIEELQEWNNNVAQHREISG